MINRLMVANRAEIASRVFRTCRTLGISTVAIHSDADAGLPYVREADVAVRLPGNTPAETYLDVAVVLAAARASGADAIHPGYGFLSENAEFARAVIEAGLTWIGPTPESIDAMGSKIEAKRLMREAGVPTLEAPEQPTEADLPLLVKASAGGGGRGMRIVRALADLDREIAAAQAEAESAFGDGTVFVEPYVEHGRHVEVQIVGNGHGQVMVLGERDCSLQRRHQKVVEESPAPNISVQTAEALHDAARKAGEAISYRGAGTVEFLYDPATERFFFLEMNTRLQVEHPVTELVHGVDLVELQLYVAEATGLVGWGGDVEEQGHAIEVRLYAEDPAADYQPQSGVLTTFEIPLDEGIRVDAGYEAGSTVSTHYDAMLAKVIAHAPNREQAARKLADVLSRARIHGLTTNRDQLVAVLRDERFLAGEVSTDLLPLVELVETPAGMAPAAAALALAERDREIPDRPAGRPDGLPQRRVAAAGDRVRGRHPRRVVGRPQRLRPERRCGDLDKLDRRWLRHRPGGGRRPHDVRRRHRRRPGRRRLARRPRRTPAYAAVRRPGRRGRERKPAGADARHRRQRRGRAGPAGRGRPAGARPRGDEDAAHRPGTRPGHGDRDRREARCAGRRR